MICIQNTIRGQTAKKIRMAINFFITRPNLAERLSVNGIPVKKTENIYDPERPAWTCILTYQAATIISEYYRSIGKQIPKVVYNTLNQDG